MMKEKMKVIGSIRTVLVGGFMIDVEVIDFKISWGKERWLVKPVAGTGEVWIEKDFK